MVLTVVIVVCCIAAGAIVLAHLVMYVGLIATAVQGRLGERRANATALSVTVVVPARNEERLLPRLLASLDAQTRKDFQVVLVNDRSTDRTGDIMTAYAQSNPQTTVVTITRTPSIGNHKLNALIAGVARSQSDVLMFTDADCVAPPEWVARISACFKDENIGVVLAPIETVKTGSPLSVFHAFDHIFKYSYTAGCSGVGMPTGGFGNNLAVRRKTVDEIGGLASIDVTSTEDAALISRIRAVTSMKARALFSRAVTVLTEPQESWKALTAQELRWHTGGLFSPDLQTRISYSFIMFYLSISVVISPACFFVPALSILPAVSFVTMSLMAVITGLFTSQPLVSYWLLLVPFIILSMGYNSYLTVRALFKPKLVWKGNLLDFSQK
ncbi:MAG: glycosyltransferase [Spirochaetales bacterium]|nr:glycosyltransferase [Spirochaetales bacterium]